MSKFYGMFREKTTPLHDKLVRVCLYNDIMYKIAGECGISVIAEYQTKNGYGRIVTHTFDEIVLNAETEYKICNEKFIIGYCDIVIKCFIKYLCEDSRTKYKDVEKHWILIEVKPVNNRFSIGATIRQLKTYRDYFEKDGTKHMVVIVDKPLEDTTLFDNENIKIVELCPSYKSEGGI